MSQEPLNSNHPWENEELTEAELDALAGGSLLHGSVDLHAFESHNPQVLIPTDSAHTSYDGAKGTSLYVDHGISKPMNLSLAFP